MQYYFFIFVAVRICRLLRLALPIKAQNFWPMILVFYMNVWQQIIHCSHSAKNRYCSLNCFT